MKPSDLGNLLLGSLPDSGLKAINSRYPSQIYPMGTVLFKQGSTAQDVYLIESGLVKLIHVDQDGNSVIVGLRSSGWPLGAAAVVIEKECPVTAETVTPCALHRIPAKTFRRLLEADAQLSSYLHKVHSWEVYVQVVQVADMGSISARRRLEGLLFEFMRSLSDPKMRFRIPLKQWEIAQCLCVTPEYITRLFKQLEKEGILQRKKGWFVVPDLEKLRHGHF